MDLLATLPAFVVAVVLISASPGPAMALILRRAALHGFRGAVPTVVGLEAGLYLWALAAGAGFAALVAASEAAYLVLRVVGAGVLLYLGTKALLAARRTRGTAAVEVVLDEEVVGLSRQEWWRAFGEGIVIQLANPKAAVFMIALYPQFVPAGSAPLAASALLGLVQVAIEIVLYLGLAAGVGRARAWFQRPVVRRRLDVISGTVLVGLGLRVAATSR